ncbi:helix-turn-helix domain-containing protein [Microbulbifer halophilus]|uniref:Helix-turn-helix domain-containing protein n=1 Tax=Microbulbifer halophilus TaxID=453963 RepID=A0ABW5EAA8_9GAMM|nr:helix-turn-helix transcriptional regulator [Microbulbifer halophilus]MCW8127128.1 helix-turn-helix transcriptional regulator [Microbulbifer halophilus]
MSEQRQRSSLFGALKQVLKAQGIRYRDLADLMQTSEPTIKRLFQDQDCKLSRLIDICDVLGISFSDLMELASKTPIEPTTLSLATEQALAADPGLMAFFMLLVSEINLEAIARQNQLSRSDLYLYLRELEKLGLIRLGRNDSIHFAVKRPIRWRLDGPLHHTLVRVNQRFVKEALSSHGTGHFPFYSASRLFSEYSIRQLNEEVGRLYQRFQQQAALDQMFYPVDQLTPFKMVSTIAPFDIPRYFSVPKFNERQAPAGAILATTQPES